MTNTLAPRYSAPRPATVGDWADGLDTLPPTVEQYRTACGHARHAAIAPRRSRAYYATRALARFALVALVILALSVCMALGAHELYDNGNPVGMILWLAPVVLALAAAGAQALLSSDRN